MLLHKFKSVNEKAVKNSMRSTHSRVFFCIWPTSISSNTELVIATSAAIHFYYIFYLLNWNNVSCIYLQSFFYYYCVIL
jgi:hypothetical protein